MGWELPNQRFTKLLTDRKKTFGRYIGADVEHVAGLFVKRGVFKPEDRERILEYTQLSHQTDALVETLAQQSFQRIDVMLYALRRARNLRTLLEDIKIQVSEECERELKDATFEPVSEDQLEDRDLTEKCGTSTKANHPRWWNRIYTAAKNYFVSKQRYNSADGVEGESDELKANENQFPLDEIESQGVSDGPERGLKSSAGTTANSKPDSAEKGSTLREMTAGFELKTLKLQLDKITSLNELRDQNTDTDLKGETTLHAAMRRMDHRGKCVEMLLERAEQLGNDIENGVTVLTIQNYVDAALNDSLETAAHLAAKLSLTSVLLKLNEKKCNFFLRDKEKNTVLDLMHLHAPEAACEIYKNASKPNDDKTSVTIDCSTVIGRPSPLKSVNEIDPFYQEIGSLAKLIYNDPDGAKEILKCETVITFVKLKWAKMAIWFRGFFLLQFVFHSALLLFVIQVYAIDCRHSNSSIKLVNTASSSNTNTPTNLPTTTIASNESDLPTNSWYYLVGTGPWAHRVSDPIKTTYFQDCEVGNFLRSAAVCLCCCGAVLFFFECIESYLKGCRYLKEFANYVQIFNIVCIFVTMWPIIFSTSMVDAFHSFAAFGAISSCILIIQDLGVVWPKFGTYVQSFGKVIKRLCYSAPICFLLFLGFAIAFSIQFPDVKPFQTLPQAILRMLVMGLGEFDYYKTLYEESGPWTPVTGHLIYFLFVTFVTVLLFSCWLVAITVLDVKELLEKSEVVQLSIQIDQLYFMEMWLNFMRPFLLLYRNVTNFVRRKCGAKVKPHFLDIHVISLLRFSEDKPLHIPMTIDKEIAKLPKELRNLLLKLSSTCDMVTDITESRQSKETAV